jgi:GTPase SAR1 family protein
MAVEKYPDYTKKASTRIIKEIEKFNPKISSKTTFQQAFEILMEEWNLEMSIETHNKITKCTLHKDGNDVYTWEFNDVWNYSVGDWEWNTIYKEVIEHIIKTRLYKRPKISKRELAAKAKADAKAAKQAEKDAKAAAKADAKAAKQAEKDAKAAAKEAKKQAKLNNVAKPRKRKTQ